MAARDGLIQRENCAAGWKPAFTNILRLSSDPGLRVRVSCHGWPNDSISFIRVSRARLSYLPYLPAPPSPAPPRHSAQSTAAGDKAAPQHVNGGGAASSAAVAPPASAAFLGSMLFTRCVSGTRVVPRGQHKSVGGVGFTGYGASVSGYPHDYLTAACAVGLSVAELDEFLVRLDKTLRKAKGEREGKGEKEKEEAGASGDARVGTGTGTTVGVAADVAVDVTKASQGNGEAGKGQHQHNPTSPESAGAEPRLNGSQSQSQPETETCLPECVEAEGDGEDQDWDGVD